MILILDYGSQFTQLIARRVRELHVHSIIVPFDADLSVHLPKADGVILSGGPASVYEGDAPFLPKALSAFAKPILGVCYGAQLLVHASGGRVESATHREFGKAKLTLKKSHALFFGIDAKVDHTVWMSHGDKIVSLSDGFEVIATSDNSPFAAFSHVHKSQVCVQFHPEVTHTDIGKQVLKNFVIDMCRAPTTWTMKNFIETEMVSVKAKVGDQHVISALSGGVDSSVVSALLQKAIGKQLTAIFVDHGLLRFNERKNVEEAIREHMHVNLKVVDASEEFFLALKGVSDPEKKRKIIGAKFIDIFDREAAQIPNATFLAQGTLYPDVIESVSSRGPSVTIKSHHNVGGLPKNMKFKLIEPLRELFKDEVRLLGKELGLPDWFVGRHPFPGPGMAVRVLGEVTRERVEVLQKADHIFIEELRKQNLYDSVWQAFAVLLPVNSVGVMGDTRTYENVCALRAVTSTDGMTANWASLPFEFLAYVSNRIINEVRGINRVVYDISSKPPATIEWE